MAQFPYQKHQEVRRLKIVGLSFEGCLYGFIIIWSCKNLNFGVTPIILN